MEGEHRTAPARQQQGGRQGAAPPPAAVALTIKLLQLLLLFIQLRFRKPLGLGPPILEPDLDLRLRQLQLIRKFCPLRDREIVLLAIFALESRQLSRSERRPRLPISSMLAQQQRRRRQPVVGPLVDR